MESENAKGQWPVSTAVVDHLRGTFSPSAVLFPGYVKDCWKPFENYYTQSGHVSTVAFLSTKRFAARAAFTANQYLCRSPLPFSRSSNVTFNNNLSISKNPSNPISISSPISLWSASFSCMRVVPCCSSWTWMFPTNWKSVYKLGALGWCREPQRKISFRWLLGALGICRRPVWKRRWG